MSNELLKAHLKQLKVSIEKYEEAVEKVETCCCSYSLDTEEYQQECKDMEAFRKLQVTERMKYLLSLIGE